jgi:hypothetical protein
MTTPRKNPPKSAAPASDDDADTEGTLIRAQAAEGDARFRDAGARAEQARSQLG